MFSKKCLFSLIVLSLVFSFFGTCYADSMSNTTQLKLSDHTKTYATEGLEDSNQLAEAYLGHIMPSGRRMMLQARSTLGSRLSGTLGNMYDLLIEDITDIANGNRTSSIMTYSAEDVYEQISYTAANLGVTSILDENGEFTQETIDAINAIIMFDMDAVVHALLADCPYELYWFDKMAGFVVEFPSQIIADGDSAVITGNVVVYLHVSADYALNGAQYECDTTYGQSAQAAAANASAIVSQYADATDEEKLLNYANEICMLTSYNDEAAAGGVSYGNPWQLIWVFDGNPNTNVVCEGYSKAFQYLCDLTAFTGDIGVITVTGTVDGGTGAGMHMWNVVNLDDGNNYLVDVTNIDEGTVGYPDQLMLAMCINDTDKYDKSISYLYTADGAIKYEYDENTLDYYSENELILKSAFELYDIAIDEENFPDPTFRSYILNNADTDPDGVLNIFEIAAVRGINVYNSNTASLKGVELFPFLQVLWCAQAELTTLDVSKNLELYDLVCYNNPLTELDVTNNTKLMILECDHCNLSEIDVSHNSALLWLRCYSNHIESLDVSQNIYLQELSCGDNPIPSLDLRANTELERLSCYSNTGEGLTQLDISNCPKLKTLSCTGNQFGSLNVSNNPLLETLICDSCGLLELDLSNNSQLKYLQCSDNALSQIGVGSCPLLEELFLRYNPLTDLDVSQNDALIYLDCGATGIGQIQVDHCVNLEGLVVDQNNLCELNLNNNPKLTELICYNNSLRMLDLTHCPELLYLHCWNNDLVSINLTGCSKIKSLFCWNNNLTNLNIEDCIALEDLRCSQNQIEALDVSSSSSLTNLDCSHNRIEQVQLPSSIVSINCTNNCIENLDLSGCVNLTDLYCSGNCLAGLNTDGLTNIINISAENNYHEISAVNGYFDLQLLPGFDISKAFDWGDPVSGSILSVDESSIVQYCYDCGNEYTCTFYLTTNYVPISELSVLYIPENTVQIEREAFTHTNAEAVVIPSGCLSIDNLAFAYCSELLYVEIPSSVTSIAQDAFCECPKLTIVYRDSPLD